MKKRWLIPLAVLAMLLCMPALAQEAQDITADCAISATAGKFKLKRINDRDWGTTYVSNKVKNPYVALTAPQGQPIYGLYVCFGDKVTPWRVEAMHQGKWETVYQSTAEYAHQYAPLNGETEVRVVPDTDKQAVLTISEIFAFGEGDVPGYVQQWEPTCEKADLLVISAHPDDEILFFGGTIPYYAAEQQMNVVVAYMTCGTMERRSELLNGLWEMGLRNYPVIGTFWDKYSKKLDTAYERTGARPRR